MSLSLHHRQGDVLFVRCETLPAGLRTQRSNVIVKGETTGHAHRLASGEILRDPKGKIFLRITDEETLVQHEEHAPITLAQGGWAVLRQQEYRPKSTQLVRD